MPNGNGNHHMRERERLDFSKIRSSIQIPNLIEVQKNSYARFLQMDLLPSEREDGGLQSVFTSVFPIQDFRGLSQLDFVDYSIGNWECKCGNLKGLHHLRATCRSCGASVVTDPYQDGRRAVHQVRHVQQEHAHVLRKVRRPGRHAAQVRRERVPGARHDVRRPAQGHHPPDDLRQGS